MPVRWGRMGMETVRSLCCFGSGLEREGMRAEPPPLRLPALASARVCAVAAATSAAAACDRDGTSSMLPRACSLRKTPIYTFTPCWLA